MHSSQAGIDAPTHEYDVRYDPHAAQGRASWSDGASTLPPTPQKKGNYRPTPLRWYFIVFQMTLLMAVMGVVIWVKKEMPNSDSTAIIEYKRSEPQHHQKRDDNDDGAQARLRTSYIVQDVSQVVTVPGTTGKYTDTLTSTAYSTYWTPSETVKDGATHTEWDVVIQTSAATEEVIITKPGAVSESTRYSTSYEYIVVQPVASGSESVAPFSSSSTHMYTFVDTLTLSGSQVTSYMTVSQEYSMSQPTTIVEDGTTRTTSFAVTEAYGTEYYSTGATTAPATTYISYGKVTITSVYTDPDPPKQKPIDKPTEKPTEKVVNVVTVKPDETVKKVEKVAPVTVVTEVEDVETLVVTHEAETVISEVPAYEVTVDTVEWGEDGMPTTNQILSTVSGLLATFTKSAEPTTVVTTKSPKLVTYTSDRDGSTTIYSTMKGATKTYSSVKTMMPTGVGEAEADTKDGSVEVMKVYELTQADYFLGRFLPPFLSVILSIPARIIDLNAQQYQPFHAMTRTDGAMGPLSMTLHFSGWTGFLKPFYILGEGQPVTFITMLIVWCSAVMTPLATEAIGLKIHGKCKNTAIEGCAAALGVSEVPTRILLALLSLIIILLFALLFFLRRWETGLYANPWNVAGMASLASNRDIRPQKASERKIAKEMADRRYGFGYFENKLGQTEYGIVLYGDAGRAFEQQRPISEASSLDPNMIEDGERKRQNPFIALGFAWRAMFLVFLLGLMAMILFYHFTLTQESAFKTFMNSQTFGLRFMFATIGVIISFCWTDLFVSIAMVVPYQVMSAGPQPASSSILLTRPTNGFSGFYSAVKHGQVFPAIVAFLACLCEFMPLLLANIPYTLSQVRISHDICVWITSGILTLMALTILVSFIIRWPNMPVDPRSIAGAMYYVSESAMVDQFAGFSSLTNRQREQRIKELGGTYMYVDLTTKSGTRPAVEWSDYTIGIVPAAPRMNEKKYSHVTHESIDTAYHGYAGQDWSHPQQRNADNEHHEYPQQRYTQVSHEQDTEYAGYGGQDNYASQHESYRNDQSYTNQHEGYGDDQINYTNQQIGYRDNQTSYTNQQGGYRNDQVDYTNQQGGYRDQHNDYRNDHGDITDEHVGAYRDGQQGGYAQVRNENLDLSQGGYDQRGYSHGDENMGRDHDQGNYSYGNSGNGMEYYGYRQ